MPSVAKGQVFKMKSMLEIYLTRHGETEWNKVRRMQGQKDSPLTELGIKQAKWLAERLEGKEFSYIYTSPLGRAKTTADILNEPLGAKMVIDDRLKEISLGDWEGRDLDELVRDWAEDNDAFWHRPKAFKMADKEDFKQVRDRAADFFESLIRQHGSGKILVVAHAIILKGLLNYIQGLDLEDFWGGRHILPTSLTKINVLDNRFSLVYIGETSHHRETMSEGWFVDEA